MKISRLFHWLYAILMFLPVFVIPMFAINIINRSPDPLSVALEDDVYANVDFNQYARDSYVDVYKTSTEISLLNGAEIAHFDNFNNVKLYIKSTYLGYEEFTNFRLVLYSSVNNAYNLVEYYNDGFYENIVTLSNYNYVSLFIRGTLQSDNNIPYYFSTNVINLTQMFGIGNEPTLEEFNVLFPNGYYDFTTSTPMNIKVGTETLLYNDTDIGSQFLYNIYHSTNEYFNFSHVLGLDGIYNWFNTWFFNGSAPLGFYVFWLLLVYWFVISICWLVFDMLMFLPQLFHNWIDKARIE